MKLERVNQNSFVLMLSDIDARAYMYALCVSGAVNTQGFVLKFFMRYI